MFVSRSNVMHVRFASDCGANDYGFEAEYQEYGKDFGYNYNAIDPMTFIATTMVHCFERFFFQMRIWSILLIISDLKWCIHLSRSLLLYS